MKSIIPCLWFDGRGEEAAKFYTSIFTDSRIKEISRYTEAGQEVHGQPVGSVMVVAFEISGQEFTALNGGPLFQFTEAISFQVMCESQEEVDHYWEKLGEGGDPQAQVCGWLKDRFGVSWQIVPIAAIEMLKGRDAQKSKRAMEAMMQMKKIDIAAMRRAAEQG